MIILLTVFVNTSEPEDGDIVGMAFNVKTTQNGYTFSLEDTGGRIIRCFVKAEPSEYNIYAIKGAFSDDGSMYFVRSMQQIMHNEF